MQPHPLSHQFFICLSLHPLQPVGVLHHTATNDIPLTRVWARVNRLSQWGSQHEGGQSIAILQYLQSLTVCISMHCSWQLEVWLSQPIVGSTHAFHLELRYASTASIRLQGIVRHIMPFPILDTMCYCICRCIARRFGTIRHSSQGF